MINRQANDKNEQETQYENIEKLLNPTTKLNSYLS